MSEAFEIPEFISQKDKERFFRNLSDEQKIEALKEYKKSVISTT